jgi:nitroreductase
MIEIVRTRRSIRSFTREPVAKEQVDLLVEALLRAPTSRNLKPWSFVVVDDRGLLEKLSGAKEHGSAFLKGAPLGIVVCADPARSDVWVEDCSIAAIMVQLVAQSLGLGSCWIQIRERRHDAFGTAEEHIQGVLGIPAGIKVACVIAVGHAAEQRQPVPASELEYGKVKRNRW